jgi:peroxiredoxin
MTKKNKKQMKKIIILTLLLTIVVGLSYFGYNVIQKQTINKQIESTIQKLPILSFYTTNQEIFTFENNPQKNTLIIYFHPECEHCQYEAKQISKYQSEFKGTYILMVSPAQLDDIKQFQTEYQLEEISSLKMLWDKDREFETYFGNSTFPTILIYNSNNELQKKYKGEVKIDAIIKHISHPTASVSNTSSNSSSYKDKMTIKLSLFLFDLKL